MKRYLLLSANNVDTEIDVEPHASLEDAQQAMKQEWQICCADTGSNEADIEERAASVFTGGVDGDLYYWQIKEIEV